MEDLSLSRRGFVAGATATGYALAVSPVTAWAVTTLDTDLETSDLKIQVGAGGKESMPAFVARPKKPGKYPAVIVVHEIFGVHAYIKDVCRRLANAGYVAVSPDLYFRQGDATKIADIPTLRKDIVDKVKQDQMLEDLDGVYAWLNAQKDVVADRVAITGFCWGGSVTWQYSERNAKLKAGVAWYGKLIGEVTPNVKHFPIDGAAKLTVPVLGLYGALDKGIALDSIEKMRKELAKGKSGSEIIVFPGADHGFHADYRPSYNEKAAKEGWDKMLAWLKKNGA